VAHPEGLRPFAPGRAIPLPVDRGTERFDAEVTGSRGSLRDLLATILYIAAGALLTIGAALFSARVAFLVAGAWALATALLVGYYEPDPLPDIEVES
jgi:hypothetical protein